MRSPVVRNVLESLAGRAMIIGVDRLDYSKGLAQRMDAFERFLAVYPNWHGKVTYLQITPKSRAEIQEYADMGRTISEAAGRINSSYGEIAWTPIRYVNRAYCRSVLAGLYRSARAALVTPLRDGMNLVAKEYVAAQDPADPGVLILSRFAGAATQMRDALIVNPYSRDELAGALEAALGMDLAERRRRWRRLMDDVSCDNVEAWRDGFLAALEATRVPQSERPRPVTVAIAPAELRAPASLARLSTPTSPPKSAKPG